MDDTILNRDYDLMMKYCQANSQEVDPILKELERTTYLKTLAPQMISGAIQGQFLELICRIQQAKYVLEVGTFTGYATICLARGIQPDGQVTTIEINRELEYISREFFEKATLTDKITQLWGDAKEIIPTLKTTYDIIFLDGSKSDYSFLFNLILDKLKPGGLLLVDNVLWSGKVALGVNDKGTRLIDDFNQMVNKDSRVRSLILPFRDGLMMAQKVGE